jgi:glutamate-1-semialdehyde 2,1-aminomutase
MTTTWSCTDRDREFFQRELDSFIPDKVFDAHCHLWPEGMLTGGPMPSSGGVAEFRDLSDCLYPGRRVQGLYVPWPDVGAKLDQANQWVAQELPKAPGSRGLFVVRPQDDPEWVAEQVRRLGLCGLKCYHSLASPPPTWELDIPAYLPEPLVKMADRQGWIILLHMVKARAVADPGNQHWIRHYCQTYPNMKLILAHSARGFQPSHNLEGLPKLAGLDNLYFDTSANCEPMAHLTIIRLLGHEKLMYGSDFPVSHERGRSLGAADSFVWLYAQTPVWGEKQGRIHPALVGHEHLRSLKWACWAARLTDRQVEDIFWNNAVRLLGLK